ncbi:MAG: T9SS type A sorting domain-containing protein [FCB group bacterium]|nr:T9SS type A sorting domain-containing protein [FCB group bacterium]
MIKTSFFLTLILSQVFCTDYLNVEFDTGYEHAELEDISKITFSSNGSQINFILTSGSINTRNVDDVVKMLFETSSRGDASLPVELVSFSASRDNSDVILKWQTASEVENYGFEVERKHADIKDWTTNGFVEGNGSVTTISEYSYTDRAVGGFTDLKYRLKQLDYNGSYDYSPEVSVTGDDPLLPFEYRLYNNYPNPFNPTTTIRYEIMQEGWTSLIIYDILGREVELLVNEQRPAGGYVVKFNASDYSAGVYFCRIRSGEYSQLIKLLLVK